MSATDWEKIRSLWENDTRKGFTWLCKENGITITPQAVRKRADRDQWEKKVAVVTVAAEKPKKPRKPSSRKKVTGNPKRKSAAADGKKKVINEPVRGVGALMGNQTLTGKQNIFVREFLKDFNAARAARAAGYSQGKNGSVDTGSIVSSPAVQKAIREAVAERAAKNGLNADSIMQAWADIVAFDSNELVQVRRIPCAYCYAEPGQKQYTIQSYEKEKEQHEKRRLQMLRLGEGDIGEFPDARGMPFVDTTKSPNPECPVCHGVGLERLFTADTRHLSPVAKRVYCGAKTFNGRVELIMVSKERAMENLAKALGVFDEKEEEKTVEKVSGEQLLKIYNEKMRAARERQAIVDRERGLDDGVVDAEVIEKGSE